MNGYSDYDDYIDNGNPGYTDNGNPGYTGYTDNDYIDNGDPNRGGPGGNGAPNSGVGYYGNQNKRLIGAGLTVAAASLGFLVVCTIIVGWAGQCGEDGGKAKEAPILMALFVGVLAAGTWMLRGRLQQGLDILDSLPQSFGGSSGFQAGNEPQKPPQLSQWEGWTFSWMACFVAIVWGGIIMLEVYCILPHQPGLSRC